MNTNYNSNEIKYTPDFVYTPPSVMEIPKESESVINKYICKFKTAIYGGILFSILSLPIAYKILEMLAKLISNNIELFDKDYNEPLPLGRFIMAILISTILFFI
tara:strand:- start:108 stop:419 length:312 start_codon:yes stop_codon:yes gene_type:complete